MAARHKLCLILGSADVINNVEGSRRLGEFVTSGSRNWNYTAIWTRDEDTRSMIV